MFGIEHCVWFRCLLNGSNHFAESDARPSHLCPVDLRKLQLSPAGASAAVEIVGRNSHRSPFLRQC
jgi:hypothetical protein